MIWYSLVICKCIPVNQATWRSYLLATVFSNSGASNNQAQPSTMSITLDNYVCYINVWNMYVHVVIQFNFREALCKTHYLSCWMHNWHNTLRTRHGKTQDTYCSAQTWSSILPTETIRSYTGIVTCFTLMSWWITYIINRVTIAGHEHKECISGLTTYCSRVFLKSRSWIIMYIAFTNNKHKHAPRSRRRSSRGRRTCPWGPCTAPRHQLVMPIATLKVASDLTKQDHTTLLTMYCYVML